MAQVFVLLATALSLWATAAVLRRQYLDKTLTARRFALIFTLGWSIALSVFYFLGLSIASHVRLSLGLIGLGTVIVSLNILVAFPAAYYLYQKVLIRYLEHFLRPSNSGKTD